MDIILTIPWNVSFKNIDVWFQERCFSSTLWLAEYNDKTLGNKRNKAKSG
jgi:hypothetical protein